MSIVSQLIAAFKREAEKTPPVPNPYPGGPTGGNGPDLSTADDGHEFRQPPPSVGGKPVEDLAVDGGDEADEAAAKLNSNSVNPLTVLRDKPLAKDLESDDKLGDFEVQDAIADKEPPPPPTSLVGGVPPGIPEGHVPGSEGAAGGAGIPEGHVPSSEGAAGGAGIPEGHVPSSEGAAGGAGIPEGHVPGGEAVELRRSPAGLKVEDIAATEDPDAGGESAPEGFGRSGPSDIPIIKPFDRPPPPPPQDSGPGTTDFTVDDLPVAPVDGGGEVAELRRPPGYIGETEKNLKLSSSDPEEGGEVGGEDFFKVKMEEVLVSSPAAPGGIPISYPIEDGPADDDAGGADAFMRPAKTGGKTIADFDSALSSEVDEAPDGDSGGVGEALKGKADPGKLNFEHLYDKASPVLASTDPADGADEPPDDAGSGVAAWLARGKAWRPHKAIGDDAGAAEADSPGEDDDLEFSTLVRLRPQPAAKEMLPGLGGEVPDDAELDLEAEADDDTDESDL